LLEIYTKVIAQHALGVVAEVEQALAVRKRDALVQVHERGTLVILPNAKVKLLTTAAEVTAHNRTMGLLRSHLR
jgi:hypothetical protein